MLGGGEFRAASHETALRAATCPIVTLLPMTTIRKGVNRCYYWHQSSVIREAVTTIKFSEDLDSTDRSEGKSRSRVEVCHRDKPACSAH